MLFSSVITLSYAQYSEENSTIHSPTIVNNCLAKFWSDWGNKSYSKFSSTILSETAFNYTQLIITQKQFISVYRSVTTCNNIVVKCHL